MKPKIISGNRHQDNRGILRFNNDFDASQIKRVYIIENANTSVERAWQGHKIEQRWFTALRGKFIIKLIEIDHWEEPNKNLEITEYILSSDNLDFLHIPAGYISYIKATEDQSKLMVFADYFLNEINDEYRYPLDYFIKSK